MPRFIFLIMFGMGLDDIPVKVFLDSDSAIKYAENLTLDSISSIIKRLECPSSDIANVVLITFKDGDPISRVVFKEFEVL